MTIQPLRDVVLIKADAPKTQTESGILLLEDWKTLPLTGTIKAKGPEATSVNVGDRVYFVRYASVVLPDEERLCKQRHIIGLLDE